MSLIKKYNVGVIGYGWVSGAHIVAINETSYAQVKGIYSSRKLNPAEVTIRHGEGITCYSNLDAMLHDPNIHVVSICSYPQDHARYLMASVKAGKHIIVEKPLALTLEDCLSIQQAVQNTNVKICVCFECRFSSQLLVTKSIIDQGFLGRIHYGEIDYYHGLGPWYGQYRWNIRKDAGGSSLLSAGCHALDALLLCMGNEIESVYSSSTNSIHRDFASYEYPTTSVTILKFKDGRIGKVASVIDCLQPYYFHVHLVGSEGSLLDNKFYSSKFSALNKDRWSELSMKMVDSGDVSDHPYKAQFEAFFAALTKDEEMPLTSLSLALKTHHVIFAADRSAREGKPVSL